MRAILRSWLLILGVAIGSSSWAVEPLLVGVAPHSSVRVILESHAGLRQYLENYFGQHVQIVTAPTFSEFTKRSMSGAYDLLITSPHLALIAKDVAQYEPLMTYTQGLETVLVSMSTELPIQRPLRVIGLDPVSFVTLTGLQHLQTQGFDAKSTMQVQYTSASDSSGLMIVQGKADVAIMSLPNYNKLNDELRSKLHIVWKSDAQPSRIYLAKAGKKLAVVDWKRALQAFSDSPEGQAHLTESKLKGFRVFDPQELLPLRPLADATLQLLDH